MRNALPAALAYAAFGSIVALWLPLMVIVAAVAWPFDRNKVIAGRSLRLCARLISTCYPAWRMELRDVPRPARGRPFVVIANHESILDVFLISRLPWEMKWMAKASLFRIPWVGAMLKLAGDIPVLRGDAESGAHALALARGYLERGMPVMVFPEGTRNKDGRLLPFKPGAFKLALETGADLLPVAVHGTAEGMPVHSPWIRPTRARLRVLPPVSLAGRTIEELPELIAAVRASLQTARDTLAAEAARERHEGPQRIVAERMAGRATTEAPMPSCAEGMDIRALTDVRTPSSAYTMNERALTEAPAPSSANGMNVRALTEAPMPVSAVGMDIRALTEAPTPSSAKGMPVRALTDAPAPSSANEMDVSPFPDAA